MRFWIVVLLGLVWSGFGPASLCHAQHASGEDEALVGVLISAGSPARPGSDDTGGHGWAVLPRDQGGVLVHLPPRTRGLSGVDDTVPGGTLRRAAVLSQMPVAMAAEGRRVVLIYEASASRGAGGGADGGADQRRPVRSMTAEPAGRGLYRYLPEGATASFTIEPSLTARGELISAVGALNSVFVLMKEAGEHELHELTREGWRRHDLPEGLERPRLVAGHPTALALEVSSGMVHLGRFVESALVWDERVMVQWPHGRAIEPGLVWLGERTAQVRFLGEDGVELVWGVLPGVLGSVVSGQVFEEGVAGVALVPLMRDGRLALLFPAEAGGGMGGRSGPTQIVELSGFTGRTLYHGPALASGPVSREDFRLLALMLLAVMTGVMVFVLRQPRLVDIATLPEGTCLAPPGRRIAATLLDWVMLATVSALVLNTPLNDTVTVVGLLNHTGTGRGGGLETVVTLLVIAWAWGTVFEGLFGRTPGKWLIGSRVVSVGPMGAQVAGGMRIGLVRSGVRNFFKWFLLPWALAEVMTPGARHRGDQSSRAAVVLDLDDEEEPPAEQRDDRVEGGADGADQAGSGQGDR